MRISGGYLKGRRINSPDKGPGIRPTTEKVKLAIFSVIGQEFVKGKRVLDLFSCTGALGLEAISRGALSVVFVEKKYKNCKLIKSNVDALDVTEKSEIKCKYIKQKKEIAHDNRIPILEILNKNVVFLYLFLKVKNN